jgi:phosphoribosylformylglycinamidine synthase subunit PurL
MRVAIVLFPGSNCAQDMELFFKSKGHEPFYIWHKEDNINNFSFELLIIPGGFTFGDRLYEKATDSYIIDPGVMATKSPVCKIIKDANEQKIPIIGVCNGFQILTNLNLLPGNLCRNSDKKFICKKINCEIMFNTHKGKVIEIDVANEFGNYSIGQDKYNELVNNDQIIMCYKDESYRNQNGSKYNIAGVCNVEHNIFGMMPHFERNMTENNLLYDILMEKINNKYSVIENSIETLMFSEHISYKSTKKYLRNLHVEGQYVVQGPGENAGIVDIGDGYCIAIRVESHNHPTFIDPYRGASTGVGGILRDIFTMGARPIGILDFLRFGNDENSNYLLNNTISGISEYGNCFGVANVGGQCIIDPMYNKNPLVNVACLGIVKKDKIIYGNALNEESLLIYVGSKTGNEGVNGAAMASQSFDDNMDKEKMKDNIQTGDPFLEKLLLEACMEITENKLAEGMQDMGAGGVLCATLEVVERGRTKTCNNFGCEIFVDKIPTKHKMTNVDKLISESQERMLIVSTPKNRESIFSIFEKWDLEYSVIGKVNNSGRYLVKTDDDVIIYDKDISKFEGVTEDWPTIDFEYQEVNEKYITQSSIWDVYDSTIGNRTLENNRTRQNFNYSILNIHENNKKLMISWSTNFDDCYNIIVQNKYIPLGLVNCLNYGHPNDSMGALKTFLEELTVKCKEKNVPVLGGNVSLYNATNDRSINPCPILVMIGINE